MSLTNSTLSENRIRLAVVPMCVDSRSGTATSSLQQDPTPLSTATMTSPRSLSTRRGARKRNPRRINQGQIIFYGFGVLLLTFLWFLVSDDDLLDGEAFFPPPPLPTKHPIRTSISYKDLTNENNTVSCGGHSASSCSECPQGNGELWCNGECAWCSAKEDCMSKKTLCDDCGDTVATDETACSSLQLESCIWCPKSSLCTHIDKYCPGKEPLVWNPPPPEPWFSPPDPINKYGKNISVVLPCGSEHAFFARTVKSVFAATPPEILHEIIVIDDYSDPPLEGLWYEDENPADYKLKFLRSHRHQLGLIDAKHQGAEAASGDIIVFFDCHVKPAIGYYEPFVREISENPKRVVVPTITGLDVATWKETGRPQDSETGGLSKCYLTFDANFRWFNDEKPWVPIMSGGLLAIGRDWFFELGGHDQEMQAWGGENIDLSLRIWRCGGEIVYAPRSYVGHMWRVKDKKETSVKYKLPAEKALGNRARAFKAHALKYFLNKTLTFPEFQNWRDNGGSDLDLRSIQEPLSHLQCKSFDWYLDFFSYIYRDDGMIPKQVFQLTPDSGKTCLSLKGDTKWGGGGYTGDKLALSPCTTIPGLQATNGTQYWHPSMRNAQGDCCTSLRVWNTDQCTTSGLSTGSCKVKHSVTSKLEKNGLLLVGTNCLRVDNGSLKLGSCDGASTWEKLRPFEPPEFTLMSPELKTKWLQAS